MYQIIYHFVLDQFLKGFDFRQSYKLLQSTPTDISRKVVWVVTAIIGSGGDPRNCWDFGNLTIYRCIWMI